MARQRKWLIIILWAFMTLSGGLLYLSGCGAPEIQMATAAEARFTILLAEYNYEGAEDLAEQLQQRAQSLLKSDAIWKEMTPDGIIVNYGRFALRSEAEKALKTVKKSYRRMNPGPLQFTYIREMPQPDPPAPEEWNLLNRQCGHSLEIAVYFNDDTEQYYQRKPDAVQHVKNLRDSGEEAYFIHGRNESHVYVGCFQLAASEVLKDQYGRPTFPPMIQMLISRYPYHYENGNIIHDIHPDKQGNKVKVPRRPVVVNIEQLRQEIPF